MLHADRVLVVEDDPLLMALMRAGFRSSGVTMLEAASGRDALEVAVQARPAVMLLDAGLPDMDGCTVCRRVRADERVASMRVVMISARTAPADLRRARAAGIDDYVEKPFSPSAVVERVRALLREVAS